MRIYSKEDRLDSRHWSNEFYIQRMTVKEWKQILLHNDDNLIFNGHLVKLVGKSIGCGVVEVMKLITPPAERKESDNV